VNLANGFQDSRESWHTDPFLLEQARKYAPQVWYLTTEMAFPASIDWILQRSTLYHGSSFVKSAPLTQTDLATFYQQDYWFQIDESDSRGEISGETITAPIYVSMKYDPSTTQTTIWYTMMYALQPGQGFHIPQAWVGFMSGDASCWSHGWSAGCLRNYGRHQRDQELIAITLDSNFALVKVEMAAHGDLHEYPMSQLDFVDGTHVIIGAALCGHASHPPRKYDYIIVSQDRVRNKAVISQQDMQVVDFVDIHCADGNGCIKWNSWDRLIPIGLNSQREPINSEIWMKYAGVMGGNSNNDLETSLCMGTDQGLDGCERDALRAIDNIARGLVLPFIENDWLTGNGGTGPGGNVDASQRKKKLMSWWMMFTERIRKFLLMVDVGGTTDKLSVHQTVAVSLAGVGPGTIGVELAVKVIVTSTHLMVDVGRTMDRLTVHRDCVAVSMAGVGPGAIGVEVAAKMVYVLR